MAEIVVSRPKEGWWAKGLMRLVSYEIVVDEARADALRHEDQVTVFVTAGRHTVRAKLPGGGGGSQRIAFDLGDRDRAVMRCEPGLRNAWLRIPISTSWHWRSRYLDLQLLRVEPIK